MHDSWARDRVATARVLPGRSLAEMGRGPSELLYMEKSPPLGLLSIALTRSGSRLASDMDVLVWQAS